MTKLCNSCEYLKFCARSGIEDVGCDRYRKDTTTNEEWLRSATTEQLADVLLEHFEWGLSINAEYCFTEKYVEQNREHILEWLKQPHSGE